MVHSESLARPALELASLNSLWRRENAQLPCLEIRRAGHLVLKFQLNHLHVRIDLEEYQRVSRQSPRF